MRTGLNWTLTWVVAVALPVGAASAAGGGDPRSCKRANLSPETQAYCDTIAGMRGRDRFKAKVLKILRRTNKPPVADLQLDLLLPRGVILDASGSTDEDGFPEHYTFQLFDDDTGEILANPLTTREPFASLEVRQDLPANLRASVIVEDDERAVDTTEMVIPLGASITCSNTFFDCSIPSGQSDTTCTPTSVNDQFSTGDLLDAAQRCDFNISETTTLVITAAGGAGGRGANVSPSHGGAGGEGGAARMATTLADLDSTYGSPAAGTTYCYGIGKEGVHGDTGSGAGGASSLLRTCQNVSQTATTGVLLIGGGGGGGGAGDFFHSGMAGGRGGITISDRGGPTEGAGAPGEGTEGGGGGGSGGQGGAAPDDQVCDTSDGAFGVRGEDGIGGKGGFAAHWGTATFKQGNPQVTDDHGSGASQKESGGGAGGGGYGGGGSGCFGVKGPALGAGGGGSYAAKSSVATSDVPSDNAGTGYLHFTFQP